MVNGTYPFVEFADSTIQHRRIMSRLLALRSHSHILWYRRGMHDRRVTYEELPKKIDAPIVVPLVDTIIWAEKCNGKQHPGDNHAIAERFLLEILIINDSWSTCLSQVEIESIWLSLAEISMREKERTFRSFVNDQDII